jgi:Ser/Thr protein kinase RdoA (MazF antagonist)
MRDAGLVALPGMIRPREGRAWLVEWQGTRGVLRRVPAPADPNTRAVLMAGLAWLHVFLARLDELGFPSPRPLPSFGGNSWTIADGMLWEILSFLPGHAVGWAAEPPMEEIGALLARYHATACHIETASQRPAALPLANVPEILLSSKLPVVCADPDRAAVIGRLAGQLARDLDDIGHLASARGVL